MYIYPVTVEFEDVDAYGIANHAKVFSYCERARVHFLDENNINAGTGGKYGIVITDITAKFRQPLLMLDNINIELQVKEIDRIKFEWAYTIRKEGKVAIKLSIQQVVIDQNTKSMIPIPKELNEVLEKILIK